jgi:hypothetical protein
MNAPLSNQNQPKELSWQAPEFAEYQKHPLWFIAFGIFTALLVLFGIYTKSWSTAVTFLMFGIIGVIFAAQKPKTVQIKLTGNGVQINSTFYNYKVIKKFWIVYNPPAVKNLYFETTAYLNRTVKVELDHKDPRAVRDFLKRYLEEDLEANEDFSDVIARTIRF